MDKFWMVWKEHGGVPTMKHADYDSARREAERLAVSLGGKLIVLEAVAACERTQPVQWEILADAELPF